MDPSKAASACSVQKISVLESHQQTRVDWQIATAAKGQRKPQGCFWAKSVRGDLPVGKPGVARMANGEWHRPWVC